MTLVETKVISGVFSTSKKSPERRWVSRSSAPVETEASWTVALTVVPARGDPTSTVAVKSLKVPRTLATMRCRAVKDSSLWLGSMVQVPGVRSLRLAMSGCSLECGIVDS